MAYYKKLGVFVKIPAGGDVKTRLIPPLAPEEAAELSLAFLKDLSLRLGKIKKVAGTVFYAGQSADAIKDHIPPGYALAPQQGKTLGEKLLQAFRFMLEDEGSYAVIIGTDSPDMPLTYIKRAFHKLKHKDVVLGPCADGGFYMIGLKSPLEKLFTGINWGKSTVLGETLNNIRTRGLTLSLLPMWYDVDDAESLALLRTMMLGKILEKSGRLPHIEKIIEKLVIKNKDL